MKSKLLPLLLLGLTACQSQPSLMQSMAPVQTNLTVTGIQAQTPASTAQTQVYLETSKPIENEVIVKYRPGFRTQAVPMGAEVLDTFNTSDETTQLHRISKKTNLQQALASYQADPSVEFAIPNLNFKVQMSLLEKVKKYFGRSTEETSAKAMPVNTRYTASSETEPVQVRAEDPLAGDQWYLNALHMPEVWTQTGLGNAAVTVAVLDTGVDYDHPDLQGRVIKGADYVDKDYEPKDMHGHGTHVAGIIAAQMNNSEGVTGLAPQVKIMAVRVLDANGSGSLFTIAKGIAYAANNGAKVINLSLGSPPGGGVMRTLANFLAGYAERKGALIVAAAGNDGGAIGYPAAASKFLCVGAINQQNQLASFSNRGAELDVVAPGVGILSTFPTYEVTANKMGLPQKYATLNGTSMATPMVSAQAALIWSLHPYLSPAEVREKIESTAIDLGAVGRDDQFGNGLVSFDNALRN
ncbi:hypothetical protein COW36_08525 [bacterium (Candidatus Blackallbacteria) CG17_big_fil_post_rev_8_21_14_2_50_48_46]|uniref:Uncharacterized protein n=1 Tax=bacterium (Candidatus Blackallbacteria) CG17_big_fil_post_rev_8_21_14_2_50_48_46 TaxID=2014261 RepID=A0A2M7G683_9BACT|nr:MAG: hypothetical protein COW64_05825 [bacterium (Candidatus Blackallbacteria) CG18_big_fil_WC_8_21_14_2_50_49_26]PIW17531.1 MAG: hypothetical protein COW36_08525 [bacterium (Candidatus Blackallbacteria) CG17_big_fil_post_rev_8_21_14_2_50_48_46]PIW48386.1 MAG: hypothetical protein COW20_09875 [bacterium (Candidatus Blackallbacteria) CG13_big_fil_rev_8_21_14_2_50_49_14]